MSQVDGLDSCPGGHQDWRLPFDARALPFEVAPAAPPRAAVLAVAEAKAGVAQGIGGIETMASYEEEEFFDAIPAVVGGALLGDLVRVEVVLVATGVPR